MWLLFDRLINLLALIAGILLCGLVVLICADVGSRHFGLFSMPWSLDAAEHSLLFITFLGAPWVLREQGHIAVDILVQHMGKRTRAVADRIAYALGSVTCAILFYYACMVWWRSFEANTEIQRTFVYPEWLILSCAPPVFLILLIIFLRWLFGGAPAVPAAHEAETDGL